MRLLEKLLTSSKQYKILDLSIEKDKLVLLFKEPMSRCVQKEYFSEKLLLKFESVSQNIIKQAINEFTLCH